MSYSQNGKSWGFGTVDLFGGGAVSVNDSAAQITLPERSTMHVFMHLSADADVVLTSTPTIPPGTFNGQLLFLHSSGGGVTIQDESALPGSGVMLGVDDDGQPITSIAVRYISVVTLVWHTHTDRWMLLATAGVSSGAGAQGPIGLTGAAGATGAQGPAGADGSDGAAGATGAQGPIGLTGTAGATGAQGPIGLTSAAGATGAQGPAGADGSDGAAGATGAQGPIGLTGAAGATGAQGPIGLTGAAGATGATGATGAQGPAGADGSDGAAGATGAQGPIGLTGTAGATGAQGPIGLTGAAGAGFPAGLSVSVVRRTSDLTFASATPADVAGMSFAVTAGRTYNFKFVLLVRSDTLTVGIAASVTVPAITRFGATVETIFGADSGSGAWHGAISASDDAVVPTAVPAINTDYVMKLEGILIPSASGTLQLRLRTETGTTVVTLRQGSLGYLYDHGV